MSGRTLAESGHVAPRSDDERLFARILYDELTNLAMGRGLQLKGSHHDDKGRWVVEVSGELDLVAIAQRMLIADARAAWR